MTIVYANIDIGALPNDGTGDPLRTAFEKINENFAELANAFPEGPEGSFQFNANGTSLGTANFAYVQSNNTITISSNVLPTGNITIGRANSTVTGLFLGQDSLRVGNVKVSESSNNISYTVSVLPSQKANILVNDVIADGNLIANNTIRYGTSYFDTEQSSTSNNAANQIIWEGPASNIKMGTFTIHSRENSSNNTQTVNLVVNKVPNNSNVNYTVYGTVFQGAVLTDYNADIGYGNVRVMVSPLLNSAMTHTISYNIVN